MACLIFFFYFFYSKRKKIIIQKSTFENFLGEKKKNLTTRKFSFLLHPIFFYFNFFPFCPNLILFFPHKPRTMKSRTADLNFFEKRIRHKSAKAVPSNFPSFFFSSLVFSQNVKTVIFYSVTRPNHL